MGIELRFQPPGEDAPGYLRRQREARRFIRILDRNFDPDGVDEIVNFLAPYIRDQDGNEVALDKAADYLLDATSEQFYTMILALMGAKTEKKASQDGKSED